MKRLLLAIFVLLLTVSVGYGKWESIPLDEVIKQSDVVVIGTLQGYKKEIIEGKEVCRGDIIVKVTLKGQQRQKIILRWAQHMPVPIEDELSYISTVGKELIWLLKTRDGREYYGWHQDSVKSVSEAATIKELIAKQSQPPQPTIKSDKQLHEAVEKKCVSDKECINIDCSKCGMLGVKEGYKPYCVEGKCKCMCYGCD